MDNERKIQTLQNFYVAAIADAAFQFTSEGVMQGVEKRKKAMQAKTAHNMIQSLGIVKMEDAFLKTAELINCAGWVIENNDKGFKAVSKTCKLAAIAKKMGSESPCNMYCLNPLETMVKAVNPDVLFETKSTLWDEKECRVDVK